MIKNVLSEMGGIGLYGVISILLFFAVFTGMLIWAFSMKKNFAQKMSACPLHDGEMKSDSKGTSHEK
jgi:cytochrome c oxidase cbb3-type subunit 3